MCLDTIKRKTSKPGKKVFVGYKVFGKKGEMLLFRNQKLIKNRKRYSRVARNKWLKAYKVLIEGYWNKNKKRNDWYWSGFHVFKTLNGAKKWEKYCGGVIKKVEYRGKRTEGWQDGCRVDVADEMFIL